MKYILLLCILALCTITDIKERKIHNPVLVVGVIMALLLNCYEGGLHGALETLKGLVAGTAVFFVPYLLGWLGAGDAKLTGVIGAFFGWQFIIYATLCIAMVGGIISVYFLVRQKRGSSLLGNLRMFFFTRSSYYIREHDEKYTFPYAAAIMLGTALAMGLQVMGYV
jgi:prepilin peptidase CpaA